MQTWVAWACNDPFWTVEQVRYCQAAEDEQPSSDQHLAGLVLLAVACSSFRSVVQTNTSILLSSDPSAFSLLLPALLAPAHVSRGAPGSGKNAPETFLVPN